MPSHQRSSSSETADKKSERAETNETMRERQRKFLLKRLAKLRRADANQFEHCFVKPTLQYFLATLCDVEVRPEEKSRLGLRYPNTPEVRQLLRRLRKQQTVSAHYYADSPNAIISVLKEVVSSFPGGIFVDVSEEFYQISVRSPLDITIIYLHGLLQTLPYFLRQFVYLICRSLRNLVFQAAGEKSDAYTDLLLLFTPALFPSSVGDVDRFLRAARLTLVMVDCCERVFQPVVWLDPRRPLHHNFPLGDEEAFYYQILASLCRLEATLGEEEGEEEQEEEEGEEETRDSGHCSESDGEQEESVELSKADLSAFYQLAYSVDNL